MAFLPVAKILLGSWALCSIGFRKPVQAGKTQPLSVVFPNLAGHIVCHEQIIPAAQHPAYCKH